MIFHQGSLSSLNGLHYKTKFIKAHTIRLCGYNALVQFGSSIMKRIARFSIFLSILFLAGISRAETLTYEMILADAFAHAHALRQAGLDYEIKKKIVDEARYDLWPELQLKFTSEYVENLTGDSDLTAVGGDVYSDRTLYQSSVYLNFAYTLIDYGEVRNLVNIAKMDAQAAQYQVRKTQIDIEITILDLYSSLLSRFKQRVCLTRSLTVVQQLIEMGERSMNAGIADKLEITSRTIELEEIKSKISKIDFEVRNILLDLSFYTGETYQDEGLHVSDLSFDLEGVEDMDFKRHPEYQYHVLQHKKKGTEYEIVKRQFFPKINFYARYSFYGSDEEAYFQSIENIEEKNYSLGMYISIPFVQNLKRREELARIKMERRKIKMQMERTHDAIRNEYKKLSRQYAFFLEDIHQKRRLLILTQQKLAMLERLTDARAIELKTALEQKLSLIDRELELEKQIVERQAAIKHILIRVEGAG